VNGWAPNRVMDGVLWGDVEADRRFRRLFLAWALLFLVLGILISLAPLPPPVHLVSTSPPPRFARVLIEPAEPTPPPAVPTPKAAPVPPVKPRARPRPKPKPKAAPKAETDPHATARAAAESAGLLALKGELSDLRNDVDTRELGRTPRRKYRAGTRRTSGANADALLERDAGRGSGGIDAAKLHAAIDKTRLAERERSAVHSRLDSAQQKRHGAKPKPGRSLEEIKLVIDRNRGAIDRLYNRALRSDPMLRGKLVLQLTIASSGRVTDCRVVSSELNAPELEHKLALRVKMMNFGPKAGPTVVLNFPIDLLPS